MLHHTDFFAPVFGTKTGRRSLGKSIGAGLAGTLLAISPALAKDTEAEKQSSVLKLNPVTVSAQNLSQPAGTTEGTDSYTTNQAQTATPLSLPLQQTPQSVSVVTRQRIEDQDFETVMDVVNHAVGVSVNRYETNRAQFSSRGFKINRLMIDGVPTTWDQAWSSGQVFGTLAFYDRVEIVRGANGLMSGAGNPSASINLVHKRAISEEFTGSLEVSAGTWDRRGTVLDVSAPLSENGNVRGRLVAGSRSGDSWIDRYGFQRDFVYGTVSIDLTEDTLLWMGVSHLSEDIESPMWGGLPFWHADGSRTDFDRSKSTAPNWSRWQTSYDNYFIHLQHTLDNGWRLKASYSHGKREGESKLFYLTGYPDPMSTVPGYYLTESTLNSISLSATGPFDLFGRTHELAFGYVYNEQKFHANDRTAKPGTYPATIPNLEAYSGDIPEPEWGEERFYESSETVQQAIYSVARFSVTDPLSLIIGTRLNKYEKTGHSRFTKPYEINHDLVVTPYAGLVYDVTEHLSAYASYTSIFQPQNKRDASGNLLDPIIGESSEIGLKGAFMNGRLNASFALFHIVQDGIAQPTGKIRNNDPNQPIYEAAEGATSNGFEVQLAGQLAEGWQAMLGYTQFKLEDAEGNPVNTVFPTKLLRFFTSYQLPGAWSNLTIGGGITWQNESYTDATNPAGQKERIAQEPYALVSLMSRYNFTNELSAQVNINNVFDVEYYNISAGFNQFTYGAPRSVEVSIEYRF